MRSSLAPAIRLLNSVSRDSWYRGFIIVLTFLFYTSYHLSRKPISVVKSQLHRNCSEFPNPPANISENDTTWCNWAPFVGVAAGLSQATFSRVLGKLRIRHFIHHPLDEKSLVPIQRQFSP